MFVTRAFMVKLRALARGYCGGYQHKLEVVVEYLGEGF